MNTEEKVMNELSVEPEEVIYFILMIPMIVQVI